MMLVTWPQHDVSVDGVRIHYCRTGRGEKPPLVLIHGFSDNGLCWMPVARELEADYDVIMPDMRGHGLSQRLRPGERVDMAADVAGLIRALGLKRPIVVGHSMGAMVSYQLGVRFPELVRAVALEDPPWWLSSRRPPLPSGESAEHPMAQWAKSLAHQPLEALLIDYRREHPTWPDELLRPMCEAKKQLDPAIVDVLIDRVDRQGESWQTTLRHFPHPLLLIAGSPELGGIVTPEVIANVRELNPGVMIVTIPEVGHLIRFDNHPAFMSALRAFLQQIGA